MSAPASARRPEELAEKSHASAKYELVGTEQVVQFAMGVLEGVDEDEETVRDCFEGSYYELAKNSPMLSIAPSKDYASVRIPAVKPAELIEVVPGKLCFMPTNVERDVKVHVKTGLYRFVTSDLHLLYEPFCDDFGPVAICQVIRFCRHLEKQQETNSPRATRRQLVYYCDPSPRHCANAVFLIVTFLVLELGWSVDAAMAPFARFGPDLTEPFRDATWIQPPVHSLSVRKCVDGLLKAMQCGWLDRFDMARHERLGNPIFGTVTEFCPKFIAFKGPVAANNISKGDLASFPPHFYAQIFRQLGVDAVVRLNEPSTYEPQPFADAGIQHYDLFFEDCTVPSAEIVARFLDICDRHRKVAVHCAAGLGRTGTLIALWLMRRCDFGADEAIGFLRTMRPGCVIGPQQPFLQVAERAQWHGNMMLTTFTRAATAPCAPGLGTRAAGDAGVPLPVGAQGSATEALLARGSDAPKPESLFGGLLRVQQAEQMAHQVRDAMNRRGAKASSSVACPQLS